jgi:hypothetical protein
MYIEEPRAGKLFSFAMIFFLAQIPWFFWRKYLGFFGANTLVGCIPSHLKCLRPSSKKF